MRTFSAALGAIIVAAGARGGRAVEVIVDDFASAELANWKMAVCVWRDGKGHVIPEKPYSLTRATDPKVLGRARAGMRVEFASAKAVKHPGCYGLLRVAPVPHPAEETDCLVFNLHKEAGGGTIKSVDLFHVPSWRMFSGGPVPLDFVGTKQIVLQRDALRPPKTPMKWQEINYIQFVVFGDFVVTVSDIRWANSKTLVREPDRPAPTADVPTEDMTAGGTATRPGPHLQVFSRNVLERCTYKTAPRPGETCAGLAAFGSPGEYEPVTFSVRSPTRVPAVRVALAGDLVSAAGKIPNSAVDVRVVVPMTRWLDTRRMQEVEYALVRRPAVDIEPGRTTRFWITVKIPETAAAGLYRGTMVVRQSERVLAKLPYAVDVLPIRLAPLDDMTFFMYFRTEQLPRWGQNKAYLATCLRDMKEHGMNAISAYVYPRGGPVMTTTAPGCVNMAETLEAIDTSNLLGPRGKFIWIAAACYGGDTLRAFTKAVRDRGHDMVFYAIDEPGDERRNKQVRAIVPRMRKACPGVPITTAIGSKGIELVGDYYDTWICSIKAVDDARLAEARTKGKRLWSYECALAPSDALTSRHYFGYLLWRTGAKGAAFWAYCDGSAVDRFSLPVKDWTEYGKRHTYRHDWVWCVPDGPIPSVGWEATREGIDDFRYLRTLENLIAKAKGAGPAAAAKRFLAGLRARVRPESYTKAADVAREASKKGLRRDAYLFDRAAPEPALELADYNGIRRKLAEHIIAIQKAQAAN